MSKERPFEDITPVPNIKVGYFEKEEYLKIIDRQEKQIEAFGYQIIALQSRIEILEKSQRPEGEWIDYSEDGYLECPFCNHLTNCEGNIDELHYCWNCGAKMEGSAENDK